MTRTMQTTSIQAECTSCLGRASTTKYMHAKTESTAARGTAASATAAASATFPSGVAHDCQRACLRTAGAVLEPRWAKMTVF